MASQTTEPLTPEEAKRQLRIAAARMGIVPWVRRQPKGAIITGLATGFMLGRVPRFWSQLFRSPMGKKMINRLV